MKNWTQKQLCSEGQQRLFDAGKENSMMEARWMLQHRLGKSQTEMLLSMHQTIEDKVTEDYISMIERRTQGEPLQYIIGNEEFMGLTFKVNPHVLIPRQDTEVLIETILNENVKKDGLFLDIGTGSGCILVSVLHFLKEGTGLGIDISPEALEVAQFNAEQNEVLDRGAFLESDLFGGVPNKYQDQFDVIISNPPYIPQEEEKALMTEVKDFEPHGALFGGEDGLDFYRAIVKDSPVYLKDNGYLFFEIGHDQGEAVKGLMETRGYKKVQVIKDLAGLDRVVYGILDKEVQEHV